MKKLAKAYIRDKRAALMIPSAFLAVFYVIFLLYRLPLEAYLYGALLCLLMMLVQLCTGLYIYAEKHRARENMFAYIEALEKGELRPDSLTEEDFQKMVAELSSRCRELSTQNSLERQESLDYFTTWVHQIKTPLAVMRMITDCEDTPEHRELAAEIFRTEQYVDMVLSYIRLGGTNDFVFAQCQLDGIIRENIRKFAPQFIRKRLKLNYEGCDVNVLTDEKWLSFIIGQLLSNAVKYTPAGSVSISVSEDKKLSIRDTGIGIAAEDLPRIF